MRKFLVQKQVSINVKYTIQGVSQNSRKVNIIPQYRAFQRVNMYWCNLKLSIFILYIFISCHIFSGRSYKNLWKSAHHFEIFLPLHRLVIKLFFGLWMVHEFWSLRVQCAGWWKLTLRRDVLLNYQTKGTIFRVSKLLEFNLVRLVSPKGSFKTRAVFRAMWMSCLSFAALHELGFKMFI